MFKISDWFKLIVCTVLSSGVATAGNFGQMNFAYWKVPPVSNPTATYLVVAGGASGGYNGGGGGGAGGLLTGTTSLSLGTTYTITVGTGGAPVSGNSGTSVAGNAGNNSVISGTGLTTLTAVGGGYGNGYPSNGGNGGSGGGGGAAYPVSSGGSGTTGQGNAGGGGYTDNATYGIGGGGGGAGAVGGTTISSSTAGGAGGTGVANSITGSSVYYAGGGGGSGDWRVSYPAGAGGTGGGGTGLATNGGTATSGTANTGGGGGGVPFCSGSNIGTTGAGGSGVVIISLPNTYAVTVTGTVTYVANGSNFVYKFTSSGTFTINGAISTFSQTNPFSDSSQIAYYTLNGNTTDSMGSYNGSVTGSLSYSSVSNPFGYTTPLFNSTTGYFGSTSNSPFSGSNARSMFCWVKCNTVPQADASGMVSTGTVVSSGHEFTIGGMVGGVSQWSFWGFNYDIGSGVTPDTNWHFLGVTFDGSTLKLYLDGTQIGTTSGSGINTTACPIYIGYDNYNRPDAYINSVRIFNRALTATEVLNLYVNGR